MKEDHAGQGFSKAVALAAVVFLIIVALCACTHAQTNGTVGILAQQSPVFNAITNTTSSKVFKDIGQGLNVLFVCNNLFSGTIALEWAPQGSSTYYTLTKATYSVDSNCHSLTAPGYWPNLRATATFSSTGVGENVSAWYSAVSGPISFTPAALTSNGPGAPVTCDQNTSASISSTGSAAFTTISPINSGDTVYICGFSISFNGATAAGTVTVGYGTSNACAGYAAKWQLDTLASTPQFVNQAGFSIRAPGGFICVLNNSSATAQVNFSWASVQQ